MREPSLTRTWRNETSFSCVALTSLTGMDTRPNEIVPFQTVCMGSIMPVRRARCHD